MDRIVTSQRSATAGVIQLTRSMTLTTASSAEIEKLGESFDTHHFFRIPRLFESSLLDAILARIAETRFHDRVHDGVGKEQTFSGGGLDVGLNFLANDERLMDLVERVTGCGRIGSFRGRVFRLAPGGDYYDSWHADLEDHRIVAMSVNLSPEPYEGGLLQIRNRESGTVLVEVGNPGVGDAVVFRLATGFEHRVTALEGTAPRTAFAGWFRSQPDFRGDPAAARS